MDFDIPGFGSVHIQHLILDYNGTIAIDGIPLVGLKEALESLPPTIIVHVLTADTYGTVAKHLAGFNCQVVTIAMHDQDEAKATYLEDLDPSTCLAVGNGRNDHMMLAKAGLGVALIQEEGLATRSLLASDIVCTSIFDVFSYLRLPNRLVATLRN